VLVQAATAFIVMIFTGLLVWYSRLGWKIAVQSATAAEISARVAHDTLLLTHRPELVVRHMVTTDCDFSRFTADTTLDKLPHSIGGHFWVSNIGTGPCTVVGVDGGFMIHDFLPMKPPFFDDVPVKNPNHRIEPGSSRNFVLDPSPLPSQGAGIEQVSLRQASIYFYAVIDYVDEAHLRRRTVATRRYDLQSKRFVPFDDPDYSYRE
jgi:hypothetical protein